MCKLDLSMMISDLVKSDFFTSLHSFNKRKEKIELSNILVFTTDIINKILNYSNLVVISPYSSDLSISISYLSTLIKILNGEILMEFNFDDLEIGKKYKFQNSIVMLDDIYVDQNGLKRIKIELIDDSFYHIPISVAPNLQKVETNRRLSSLKKFKNDFNSWKHETNSDLLKKAYNFKTYVKKSSIYYSDIKIDERILDEILLEGESIKDLVLTGKINNSEVIVTEPGQYDGNPGVTYSRDLDDLYDYFDKRDQFESIFMSFNQVKNLFSNIQIVDLINDHKFKNVIFTHQLDDNSLEELKKRGYLIWNWNKKFIKQFNVNQRSLNNIDKIFNDYAVSSVKLIKVFSKNTKVIIKLLNEIKKSYNDLTSDLMEIFDNLYAAYFNLVRNYSDIQLDQNFYNELSENLNLRRPTTNPEVISKFYEIMDLIKDSFRSHNLNQKKQFFSNITNLKIRDNLNTYFVIDNRQNYKETYEWFLDNSINLDNHKLKLIYSNELKDINHSFSRVYFPFWLSSKKMNEIIYSMNIKELYLVLYESEYDWAMKQINIWEKQETNNNDNFKIIKDIFGLSLGPINKPITEDIILNEDNLLDDVDEFILVSKIRRFIEGSDVNEELIDVYPIELSEDRIYLSSVNHTLLSISRNSRGDLEVHNKKPNKLNAGDFIVLRSSERDIIRDYADKILLSEGKTSLRQIAESWKVEFRALKEKYNYDEIFRLYKEKGGQRLKISVKNWLDEENMIGPKYYEDLQIIFEITKQATDVDKVHKAIQTVEKYHVKAGYEISQILEKNIFEKSENAQFDNSLSINSFETLYLDSIGEIYLYKIIDISNVIKIPKSKSNQIQIVNKYGQNDSLRTTFRNKK